MYIYIYGYFLFAPISESDRQKTITGEALQHPLVVQSYVAQSDPAQSSFARQNMIDGVKPIPSHHDRGNDRHDRETWMLWSLKLLGHGWSGKHLYLDQNKKQSQQRAKRSCKSVLQHRELSSGRLAGCVSQTVSKIVLSWRAWKCLDL